MPVKPADAVQKLPDQRFARGHVGVRLDPHGTNRLPLTARHLVGDGGQQRGIILPDEVIELRCRVIEAELGELVHQLQDGVKGALRLGPGLGHRPQPRQINMRMAGGGKGTFLRKPALQGAQTRLQMVPRRQNRGAGAVWQGFRRGHLGQRPDRLRFSRADNPRQIGGGFRGPVQQVKRRLGQVHHRTTNGMGVGMAGMLAAREIGRHRPRLDLMATKGADHFDDLPLHPDEIRKVNLVPDQFSLPDGRLPVRHPLRQPCHAVRLDRKAPFTRQKLPMRRVQAKAVGLRAHQPHQPLTAQPQMQPHFVQRPMVRNLDGGMGKGQRLALILPAMTLGNRLALQGPTVQRHHLARDPTLQLLQPPRHPAQTHFERQLAGHGGPPRVIRANNAATQGGCPA